MTDLLILIIVNHCVLTVDAGAQALKLWIHLLLTEVGRTTGDSRPPVTLIPRVIWHAWVCKASGTFSSPRVGIGPILPVGASICRKFCQFCCRHSGVTYFRIMIPCQPNKVYLISCFIAEYKGSRFVLQFGSHLMNLVCVGELCWRSCGMRW